MIQKTNSPTLSKIDVTLWVFAGIFAFCLVGQAKVPQSPDKISPILIGATLPDSPLKTIDGKTEKLSEVVKGKKTVLVFYRGGWCPYCNTQLSGLAKAEKELKQLGYQIIAVSPDRPEKLKESMKKQNVGYQLYSDSAMKTSQALGIAFEVDSETRAKYKTYGIDLEGDSGYKHHQLPVPSVFLCNESSKVLFSYINPDYKIRLPEEVIIAAAQSLGKDKSKSQKN